VVIGVQIVDVVRARFHLGEFQGRVRGRLFLQCLALVVGQIVKSGRSTPRLRMNWSIKASSRWAVCISIA
jgi:hypothetical protein